MDIKYNVIFKDRKAVLTRYFDSVCLLFDKNDGEPDLGSIKVIDDYPEGFFCVFLSQIPVEERKKIQMENKKSLMNECVCSLFIDDRPNSPLLNEYIEILSDDLEYDSLDEFSDPLKYAKVRCKTCSKIFKVNKRMGYRSSFFEWTDA